MKDQSSQLTVTRRTYSTKRHRNQISLSFPHHLTPAILVDAGVQNNVYYSASNFDPNEEPSFPDLNELRTNLFRDYGDNSRYQGLINYFLSD